MTNKSNAKSRSRFSAMLMDGVKAFSSSLSDRAVIDGIVGLFIIMILSLLLMRNYQRPNIEPLPVGSVAAADIIAPEDLKIEDTSETNRQRTQAADSIPPIFDYNARAVREARNRLERMFEAGRKIVHGSSPEKLRATIEEASDVIIDADQIKVFRDYRFNQEQERLMIDHLESVMVTGVVSSRSHLVRLGATSILRRDTKSGQELAVTDLSSVRDLITARAALRSDKLMWPVEYDRSERRVLGEVLGSVIIPNLTYNEAETEARKTRARETIAPITIAVEKGKPIVVNGEVITPVKAALLEQAASHHPIGQRAIEFAGTVVIVMMLVLVLWQYLVRYQSRHLRVRRHFLLQVVTFVIALGLARLFFALAYIMSQWIERPPFNSEMSYKYLAPLAVGAVMVTILTDSRAAFVFSAIMTVFIGVLSSDVYLAAYTLMASVGAIYHLQNCRDRTALVRAGLWMGLVNMAAALSLSLIGGNEARLDVVLFDAFCGFVSGLLATMVALILLPLFEWMFAITTNFKLLELSNLNLPLLKQLAERAPGTYHHSIMVGLLAEAGAEAIGADALFARVACYYHDIGKMIRPTYFVENQSHLENRHDNLAPKMSSIVLCNHVKQGIELARQYKLPPRIISIIPQHHGTGLMKFFYYKARQAASETDSTALEQEFRYPGPKPQAKEAAIIMIADSVEAAARTIAEPTPTKLANMIDMIITRIRDDGQLDECDITLRELRLVAESFVKVLMGIHHHRIAYPGYDFNRAGTPALLSQVTPASEGKQGSGGAEEQGSRGAGEQGRGEAPQHPSTPAPRHRYYGD